MTNKLRSLVFTATILSIFLIVNISFAGDTKLTGKIETTTGQEYEGEITLTPTTGTADGIEVDYQEKTTLIRFDQIKTIELFDPVKKEVMIKLKTGEKFVVNIIKRMTPMFTVNIDQDVGKINIAADKIKKITFYEILKTD
jgi:hypothetical protein